MKKYLNIIYKWVTNNPSVLLFITVSSFVFSIHQKAYDAGIPMSRLVFLKSLISYGTTKIDNYHVLTEGKALYRGHYYSDKAPGVAVTAFPSFALAVCFLKYSNNSRSDLIQETEWKSLSWITCGITFGFVAGIGAVFLFKYLMTMVSPSVAYFTTVAIFLGSFPLPYSTVLMSHGFVFSIMCIMLRFSSLLSNNMKIRSSGFAVGFFGGLALASEFSSGIPILGIILASYLSCTKSLKYIALGAVLPCLTVPIYNFTCFGNAFQFAYRHNPIFKQMRDGFFGVMSPDLNNLVSFLFSAERGLFFWFPIFSLSVVGFFYLYEKSKSEFWSCYLIFLLHLIVISGYYHPEAGHTIGPRLLAPGCVLLSLPVALGIMRWRTAGLFIGTLSIGIVTISTIVSIFFPPEFPNPLIQYVLPNFLNGNVSYNILSELGFPNYWAIFLYVTVLLFLVFVPYCFLCRNEALLVASQQESRRVSG